EQVDKLLEVESQLAARGRAVRHLIYEDPRGLRDYDHPSLLSYERVQEIGREFDRANPGFFDAAVQAGAPEDTAIILYTSGTTGKPKG
ncbi:MAG TPA: long-chain fatty acid--CoA ligase, partial [Cupriavidus sp.]|nr:long-chain fatty acid--CoA ligase [Cupriavidus sp.]